MAATDSDSGDTLTYSISGQSADSSQTGYTHARTGTFGTLYINSTSGVYRYIPNDSALEGATTSQTDSFTLSVSDGTASASRTLTATVGGVNDTPVLASLSGVSFTDTANDDSFTAATATAGGSDRDTSDTLVYSITGQSADSFTHSVGGTYGTLYINSSSGAYTYVPNDSAIEGLKNQQSENFTVNLSDGTVSVSQTLTATLTGVDDTPTLASPSAIAVTDTSADDSFSATLATLSASERDSADSLSFSISGQSADSSQTGYTHSASGTYGTLYINSSSGAYKYVPDESAIEPLTSQQSESFTVVASDGTNNASQTLTTTLAGANDTPVLASLSGITFTDTSGDDSFSTATATASGSDRDTGDTLTYSITGQSADSSQTGYTHAASGTYGTLYVNSIVRCRQIHPDRQRRRRRSTSQRQTDSFTVSASAGPTATPVHSASQSLTATIGGVNDTPVLASPGAITVTDTTADDTFSVVQSSMSVTDRDSGDTMTYGVMGGSADTSRAGFTHSNVGTYGTLFVNSSTGAYDYVPNDTAIEQLASQLTEDFDLTVSDGSAFVRSTLSTTLAGVNDAPAIASLSSISVTDTTAYDSFTASTGTMSASERDAGQSVTLGVSGTTSASPDPSYDLLQQGDYGYLEFNTTSGAYRYTPTAALVNALASSKTDSFALTASDGSLTSNEPLIVNITGVDDGPRAIDTTNLTSASNRQNTGQTGLRIATTSDPEGDTVTDLLDGCPSTARQLVAWSNISGKSAPTRRPGETARKACRCRPGQAASTVPPPR